MKGSGCKQNFSDEGVLERVASENTYRDPPGDPPPPSFPPLLRIDCRLLLCTTIPERERERESFVNSYRDTRINIGPG